MRILLVSSFVATLPMLAGAATAGAIGPENEPNDSFASPESLGAMAANDARIVFASIAPGDVDFFEVQLVEGAAVVASIIDGTPGIDDADSSFAFFDSEFNLIEGSTSGIGSSVFIFSFAPTSGAYYFVVTGAGDTLFQGLHEELFTYTLFIESTPVPASIALFAVAGIAGPRRRRA